MALDDAKVDLTEAIIDFEGDHEDGVMACAQGLRLD